ncbi:MAG: BMP family ABC transporter substrate-binding protein, partial [Actinomycetota bacterium]|nr:BMP family ABC transporter substrate-binding protein [Actinomycetota bacterium]
MARNRWKFAVALMLVLALFAAACSSDDGGSSGSDETTTTAGEGGETDTTAAGGDTGEVLKVAFVHVGPTSDKGWSWAHDQGADYLKANMPNVEITTLENIAEGADSQRVFENLAADGNTLIFGTSFGYMEPMLAAGETYPDVTFMHA